MAEPTKQDISAIFKRLRSIPTNKVRVSQTTDGWLFNKEVDWTKYLTRRTLRNAKASFKHNLTLIRKVSCWKSFMLVETRYFYGGDICRRINCQKTC